MNRKVIEAEVNRCNKIAERLESNMKSFTQNLVAERNACKADLEEHKRKMAELDRENVSLKATNACMDNNQKFLYPLFQNQAFPSAMREQNLISTIVEAANRYGERTQEGIPSNDPPAENRTPRARESASFVPPVEDAGIVNLDEDDDSHTNNNRE